MAKRKEEVNTQQDNLDQEVNTELGPSDEDIMKIWSKLGEQAQPVEEPAEQAEQPTEEETKEEKEQMAPSAEEQKAEGQADLLELLPEKFRGEDVKEAVQKLVQSYRELEAQHTRTAQELAEATKLLRTLAASSTEVTAPSPQQPAEAEVDEDLEIKVDLKPDEVYSDLPGALQKAVAQAVKQAAKQVVSKFDPARQTQQAMQAVMAQMAIAQLRAQDPKTFDLVREDLLQVLKEKPHLDTIEGLPLAYEEAKQRYKKRQEELRKQIIDEEFVKSLKESLLRELAQKMGAPARQSAVGVPQGATGGGSTEVSRAGGEQKSPADVLREAILSAGTNHPLLTEDF